MNRHWKTIAPVAALACASAAAQAAPPALPAKDGVLVLPNVRVVQANPEQLRASMPAAATKSRAFKDRDTGELRAPTAEEMMELASEPNEPAAEPTVRRLANGALVARPGAAAMSHSVARRTADGHVETACVTGPTQLEAALKGAKAKGVKHEAH